MPSAAVLHLGKTYPMFVYTINATKLLAAGYVVDLSITLSKNLTCHEGCLLIVLVNHLLSKYIYVSYLRFCLEYGSVIWAPHSDFEIKLLDAFQHLVLTLYGHNIVLVSLENRRMWMDLTWYDTILHNLTRLNQADCFTPNIRRGHRDHT